MKSYWLVKSEPVKYSWEKFVKDGETFWDGVRNYAARNNLAAMKKGDLVLYYHSNEGLEIVGLAEVSKEASPDPTADDPRWVGVNLKPVGPFAKPVSLAALKAHEVLKNMQFVKLGRLSVSVVTPEEFRLVTDLGGFKLPK